jgi:hypothetical protein
MSSSNASASSAVAPSGGGTEYGHLPPKWEPTPVRPRLPIGVAILAVLIALVAIVMVVGGILFLLNLVAAGVVPPVFVIFPNVDLLGAAILAVLGIALLAIATALWRQETWALWTTVVLVFVTMTYLFFTGSITVLFVLFVVLFVYLLAVRRYFY